MANPAYHIYYGKYPDKCTQEIPSAHIKSLDGLQYRIEPGKPGEPKMDGVSFVLQNLASDGSERYPRSWFDSNSRSEAEGASVAHQLFFKITWLDKHFIGLLDEYSYSTYRQEVTVKLKSMLSLIGDSKKRIFKPFEFTGCKLSDKTKNDDFNLENLPKGTDLEDNSLIDESLSFSAIFQTEKIHIEGDFPNITLNPEPNFTDHPYIKHRKLNEKLHNGTIDLVTDPKGGTSWSDRRLAFIKIGEITLLTWLIEYISWYSSGERQIRFDYGLQINHAANGNYTGNDDTVLERAHFFADQKGTQLQTGQQYDVTILDYDIESNEPHIMMKKWGPFADDPPKIMNGYEIELSTADWPYTYTIRNSFTGVTDTLSTLDLLFNQHLFENYYEGSSDLFDYDNISDKRRYAFWPDIALYGWAESDLGALLVNLATQLNGYLFYDEIGKINLQDRLLHNDYLPGSLPPEAFEVDLGDIKPLGFDSSQKGFESYSIKVKDRIPIDNLQSDKERTEIIDSGGWRDKPSLRNTDLTVKNYRTDDLGVPNQGDDIITKIFRYSPDDPKFDTIGSPPADLDYYLPTPEWQAQQFAKSYQYPVEIWQIQWDMTTYPNAAIGGYFYVSWPDETDARVYFIREITHDPEHLLHKIKAQEVGVYSG
jgi:hypothetical protein